MKYALKQASREKMVNYLYYFELMEQKINSDKAFEGGDFTAQELKKIELIAKNYTKFKALINKYLKSTWTWNRLSPYLRATLLFASCEFLIEEKNLVIGELVSLTKKYVPDNSYKLLNGILEQMGKYYEAIKSNQKRT